MFVTTFREIKKEKNIIWASKPPMGCQSTGPRAQGLVFALLFSEFIQCGSIILIFFEKTGIVFHE